VKYDCGQCMHPSMISVFISEPQERVGRRECALIVLYE